MSAGQDAGGEHAIGTVEDTRERVNALVGFGRFADAIAEAQRGLAAHPDSAALWGLDARLQFFHGSRERARTSAGRALGLDPSSPLALDALVEVEVADGNAEAALGHARRLTETFPEWAPGYLAHAYALARMSGGSRAERAERAARVRDFSRTALRLDPEGAQTLRRASVLLNQAGEAADAQRLMRWALELYPDDEELRLASLQVIPQGETEAVRLLTGVLAQSPQQRGAARALSNTVWTRTEWLAGMMVAAMSAMMLFAYLVFGEPITLTHRTRMQVGYAFLAVPIAWGYLLFSLPTVLPRRYLFRLWGPVWWVWVGLSAAALGTFIAGFAGLGLAFRSQPSQLEMLGGYAGGITAMIGIAAALLLFAETVIVCARFLSEARNHLFVSDDDGLRAARNSVRRGCVGLWRVAAAAVLVLVPVLAAPIATSPEAAGGFAAVALALGVPPLLTLALRGARVRRLRAGSGAWLTVGAILIVVAGLAAACGCAAAHLAENDPPPTPWQLELREQGRQLHERSEQLREDVPDTEELEQIMEDFRQPQSSPASPAP